MSRQKEEQLRGAERDSGKPLQYRVNILAGMGNVGFEVAKLLADSKDPVIDSYVNEINLCHRVIRQDQVAVSSGDSITWVDKTEVGEFVLKTIGDRTKIIRRPYESLDELDFLPDYQENNPNSDITIVCARYGFDKIERKHLKGKNEASLKSRATLRSSFVNPSEDLRDEMDEVINTNRQIDNIAAAAIEQGIAQNRIYNLKEGFLGIRELGHFLGGVGYQGLIIVVSNPPDSLSNVLSNQIGHKRVIGAVDNDRMRFEAKIILDLEGKNPHYKISRADIPVIGPHNEFLAGLLKEAEFFGVDSRTHEPIHSSYFELGGTIDMWNAAHTYVATFPHQEFSQLGTTSHDTAPGIVNLVRSAIQSANGNIVRASVPTEISGKTLWTGQPARIILSEAYPIRDINAYDWREEELALVQQGLSIEDFVMDQIVEKGLLGDTGKLPHLQIKSSPSIVDTVGNVTVEGVLENQYAAYTSPFNNTTIRGPIRAKSYTTLWKWNTNTFPVERASVFVSEFEKARVGEMYGFIIKADATGKNFLGISYFKMSDTEIGSRWETNNVEYAQKYAQKFGGQN